MSWYSNLTRNQRVAGGTLAAVGALWFLGSGNDAPPAPVAAEVVTETVTETVKEESMAAAEVASERARLNRVKSKLNARKDELAALTQELDRRAQDIEDRKAAVAVVEQGAEQVAAAAVPDDEPGLPQAAYYQNCSAASAAGAAPVYRGDPGYGPHLDRDGDGVGCEGG